MNTETRQLLRINILRTASAVGSIGVSLDTLRIAARTGGLSATAPELGEEVVYLIDKGLLAPMQKAISPEIARYRITAEGRDLLATEGFE
jgi:hypothetical protein